MAKAVRDQWVRSVGDAFSMTLIRGSVRENHVVEFVEGKRMAWKPYDWTDLNDPMREPRARATTADRLAESIRRLALIAENESESSDRR